MQKFVTTTPINAVLDIPAGRIQFIAAEHTDTTVEILPADASNSRDAKAAEETTAEYANGVLTVTAAPAKNPILGNSGSIEVTIQLPAGSRIEAKTASADIRGVGRLGDTTINGAQGTIRLDETATAQLTLLAGDITIGRLGGSAQINTHKGDIQITEATHGTLELRTEAGHITVDAAHGTSATLDAGTTYGRIHNTLKNTDGAAANLTIRATTSYGNVTARSL